MSDPQLPLAPPLVSSPDSAADLGPRAHQVDSPAHAHSVPLHEQETLKQMDLVICGDLDEKLQRLDALANECSEGGQSEEVVSLRIQ